MRGSRGDGGSRERPHLRRACCTVRPKRPGAVLELELDKKNSENEMERARGYTWFFFSLVATVKEEKSEDKRGRRTEKSSILVSFSTLESFASSLEPSFFCPHPPPYVLTHLLSSARAATAAAAASRRNEGGRGESVPCLVSASRGSLALVWLPPPSTPLFNISRT